MIGKVICLEPLFQDRINNHWLAYNFSIMFRWVIALISAYFILGLGVSAYGATPKTALQSQAAHSMVNAVAHDAAECADTLDAHTSTADSTFPSSPLQLVLDDLVVDLPDLLDPPHVLPRRLPACAPACRAAGAAALSLPEAPAQAAQSSVHAGLRRVLMHACPADRTSCFAESVPRQATPD